MAAPKQKPVGEPVAPYLPRSLERVATDRFIQRSSWEDVELVDPDLALIEAVEARLNSLRIDGGDLGDARLIHVTLEDSELVRVSAANVKAERAVIGRSRLHAVRMTGADLTLAELRDVAFEECRADFTSFNGGRLEDVRFSDCLLRDADFGRARMIRVRFDRCDLSEVDFTGADFSRCEMRGCTLDGAKGIEALRGVAMPYADVIGAAATLAAALGITVLSDEG
jgi:uncharacterized protein YjbI with pentapeptide repeats